MNKHLSIPKAIWALGFVSLLMDVSSELIHSLLPVFMATTLGLSALTIGLIEGLAESTALIVKVFSGVLSDWCGKRKPLALLGYALGACSKPLFAIASSVGMVAAARLIDRIGKGVRGAPRDALIADLSPPGLRGASFGLRQALDTAGAFVGPLLAMLLMLAWSDDFRSIFWIAVIPAFFAVTLLAFGVKEPHQPLIKNKSNPLCQANLARLPSGYWQIIIIGAVFTLARFSETFLVLRANQGGLPIAWTPMVLIVMNLAYAGAAYPFGKLADRYDQRQLLVYGLLLLIGADICLAIGDEWLWVWPGIILWGLHMAMTQGLFAMMIANTSPSEMLGTAFGLFNLVSGIAMLCASSFAGLVWEYWDASMPFIFGAIFALMALLGLQFTQSKT